MFAGGKLGPPSPNRAPKGLPRANWLKNFVALREAPNASAQPRKFAPGNLRLRVELSRAYAPVRGGARPPRSSRHLRFAVFFCASVAASASSLSDWSVLAEARIEKSSQLRSTV